MFEGPFVTIKDGDRRIATSLRGFSFVLICKSDNFYPKISYRRKFLGAKRREYKSALKRKEG